MEYIQSAREAELNAAQRMRELGYFDARVVPPGPDGGVDVVARDALAQVKWRSEVAGRPELQRLVGASMRDTNKDLLFFVASGYSSHALAYADEVGMYLFRYDTLGRITPLNLYADRLIRLSRNDDNTVAPYQRQSRKRHSSSIGKWFDSVRDELPDRQIAKAAAARRLDTAKKWWK